MPSIRTVTLRSASGKTCQVGHLGYGLMNMTWKPKPTSDEQAFEAIKLAVDGGSNMLNSGEFYGSEYPEMNLDMLARFYAKNPSYADKTFISVKGGVNMKAHKPDSSEDGLRTSVNNILKHLDGKKRLDLFEPARRDHTLPIEDIMRNLKKLVDEGLFDYIGLSEVSAETIRRAHAVHPVSLVEVEYSFVSLDIEQNKVLETCAELDIPIAAYSPLGRGMLTGTLKSASDIPEGDLRRRFDRFQPENFHKNLELTDTMKTVADRVGCTPTQLALAWLMSNPTATVLPLPGSSRPEGVKEALGALEVELDEATLKEIRFAVDAAEVHGGRYNDQMKGSLEG